jgi:chemotaxis protein histidine kinase CheA
VVTQLNPIEQVKIFISTNGVVITKYLRVSFTRIARGSEIQSIMVTISDETESVLLQQHMEESETRKKKETEYMLNIFRVDPIVLREFLQNTRKVLKGISERYENGARTELNELLKYTFQAVHTVKGNAMSLGVDLVAQKLHEIEESITLLRDKNVTPDKFLALLYEIEEVDKMALDMGKVLEKVGEVYKNFQSPQSKNSFNHFEESLKQGLDVMSREIGKNATLKISNPKGVSLPDEYLSPVRDIVVQMMRNSLSHGIEIPESRLIKGKAASGAIALSIDEVDSEGFVLCYKDDGRGLDLENIRKKAVAKGFVSEERGREMTGDDLISLLFDNGFSTSDKVDSFSGRGQGLSIVRSIIQEYGGSFNIKFEKDKYFELRFILPAILEGKMDPVA